MEQKPRASKVLTTWTGPQGLTGPDKLHPARTSREGRRTVIQKMSWMAEKQG